VQLQIERSVLNWHEKHMAFYLCVAGVEYKHMAFIQHLFCRLSQSIHLLFINENSIELMFTTHTHTHTRDTER
jgi:mannitol/fructose-specific phosphotransferase system IIA component